MMGLDYNRTHQTLLLYVKGLLIYHEHVTGKPIFYFVFHGFPVGSRHTSHVFSRFVLQGKDN